MTANLTAKESDHLRKLQLRVLQLKEWLESDEAPTVESSPREWFAYLAMMKQISGNASNDLAFITTLMARDYLAQVLPMEPFDVAEKPQGAPGLDIDATTTEGLRVIGEIKATVPHNVTRLGAQQAMSFARDFVKLSMTTAHHKFFFVTDAETFRIVRASYAHRIPGLRVVLLTTGESFVCAAGSA